MKPRFINLVARNRSVYQEVDNFFGEDATAIELEMANQDYRPYRPTDRTVIGAVSAHPQSGPRFLLTAKAEDATDILAKHP